MVSAFSIPQAKRQERIPQNPGPGQYNTDNPQRIAQRQEPHYSIGKEKRDSPQTKNIPGPGAYNAHDIKSHLHVGALRTVQTTPSYSIYSKPKEEKPSNPVGPGHYNVNYAVESYKTPAYSMMKAKGQQIVEMKPGPGQYQLNKSSVVSSHAAIFGHEKRNVETRANSPGPGAYQSDKAYDRYLSKHEPQYAFGIKLPEQKNINIPGPGAYNAQTTLLSRVGGIMSRDTKTSMEKVDVPGPGAYQNRYDPLLMKSPSYSLSKSKRDVEMTKGTPGPGQYDSLEVLEKLVGKSPNYKFGHDSRYRENQTKTPGPGDYELNPPKQIAGSYIGIKTKDHDAMKIPGPGAYEIAKQANKSGGYSISRSARSQSSNLMTPGPGAYNQSDNALRANMPRPVFPIDKRQKQSKETIPGPGSYDIKPMFADVPKYLMPHKY